MMSQDEEFLSTMREVDMTLSALPRHLQIRAEKWQQKLYEEHATTTLKKHRNLHALLLLHCIREGTWYPPMDRVPYDGPLKTLPTHMACMVRKHRDTRQQPLRQPGPSSSPSSVTHAADQPARPHSPSPSPCPPPAPFTDDAEAIQEQFLSQLKVDESPKHQFLDQSQSPCIHTGSSTRLLRRVEALSPPHHQEPAAEGHCSSNGRGNGGGGGGRVLRVREQLREEEVTSRGVMEVDKGHLKWMERELWKSQVEIKRLRRGLRSHVNQMASLKQLLQAREQHINKLTQRLEEAEQLMRDVPQLGTISLLSSLHVPLYDAITEQQCHPRSPHALARRKGSRSPPLGTQQPFSRIMRPPGLGGAHAPVSSQDITAALAEVGVNEIDMQATLANQLDGPDEASQVFPTMMPRALEPVDMSLHPHAQNPSMDLPPCDERVREEAAAVIASLREPRRERGDQSGPPHQYPTREREEDELEEAARLAGAVGMDERGMGGDGAGQGMGFLKYLERFEVGGAGHEHTRFLLETERLHGDGGGGSLVPAGRAATGEDDLHDDIEGEGEGDVDA
ncbi:unnamed protein product [Vitrella brassicaformis CCMP3155]|uniref:DUF4485 domain-containing protein n=2 Tax=Vitrella brassicaformis TaxID=1169539 RepID=A0A0G4EU33_VITBC|nr:unnamed protein product [Vitrella brassicaformis CCMP3155]|eukprot:CEM02148.1 unnamed protein product [Vitrella brassicaformis CCMP3155]